MAEEQDREFEQIEKVKDFLKEGRKRTLAIAKHVMGVHASCKTVNPLLYKMEKKNIIRKVVPQPPEWELTDLNSNGN